MEWGLVKKYPVRVHGCNGSTIMQSVGCASTADGQLACVWARLQWSTATLQKLDVPVDMQGKPWPLDAAGKPILKD